MARLPVTVRQADVFSRELVQIRRTGERHRVSSCGSEVLISEPRRERGQGFEAVSLWRLAARADPGVCAWGTFPSWAVQLKADVNFIFSCWESVKRAASLKEDFKEWRVLFKNAQGVEYHKWPRRLAPLRTEALGACISKLSPLFKQCPKTGRGGKDHSSYCPGLNPKGVSNVEGKFLTCWQSKLSDIWRI